MSVRRFVKCDLCRNRINNSENSITIIWNEKEEVHRKNPNIAWFRYFIHSIKNGILLEKENSKRDNVHFCENCVSSLKGFFNSEIKELQNVEGSNSENQN